MGTYKNLANQTAIYGLSSLVGRFLNYLLTPLYTWLIFKPYEFGVVTELYAYVVFLLVFLTYGMETGYFRFMQDKRENQEVFPTIIITLFSTSFLFIILVIIFINPVSSFLQYEHNKEYIILLSIIVAIDAFTALPFAKLRHRNKASRFAILKIVNIIINVGCNLIFLLLFPYLSDHYNISFLEEYFIRDNMIIYVFISNLIASVVTLFLLLPEIFDEKFAYNSKLIKKILFYSFPLLLAGIAGQTNEFLDRLLLKHFTIVPRGIENGGEYILAQIGIYGANFKLAVIMTLFIQAFRYAFEPMFFKQGKDLDAKEIYARIMKYFVIFCLCIFLIITLYIDFFKYFIGIKFHEGLHIVPIILFAYILLGILFNLSLWYKLNDLTKFGLIIASIGASVTIVFNILLIPKFGYTGSAWTHVLSYLVMVSVSYFLMRKHFPIKYDLGNMAIYIFIALLLFFTSRFININMLMLKYVIHTFLFLSFVIFVLFKEKYLVNFIKNASKNR